MKNKSNQITIDILFVLNAGNVGFNDPRHFQNFVRYFFGGKSGRHIVNNHTKDNTFTLDPNDDDKFYHFMVEPNKFYNIFIEKFKNKIYNFSKFRNDVLYVPFLVSIDGVAVSNFLELDDNNEPTVSFEQGDGEHVWDSMCKAYGTEKELFDKIETFLDGFDNKFTRYKDFNNAKDRLKIEKIIHKECQKKYPIDGFLCAISHDDQFEDHSDYHIHRIFEIE